MDLEEKWKKLIKIQQNLDNTITKIKQDLEKQKFIRSEWNLRKNEWLKKTKITLR